MTLLTFSFTGENTTGDITFTLTQEYKFKNLWLKDIKYNIRNEVLQEAIDKSTANTGLSTISPVITSSLAVEMDFLDSKDCVTYSKNTDGSATENTGLIPFGHAGSMDASEGFSDYATISHSYPYHLINNRPQTWSVGKQLTFSLYFRDVQTDGLIKNWAKMKTTTDAFSDICDIDITLQLE
tara:strand:+ start:28 stop:573 length:546 start_codon:yes stop_codon:yes gene_type:complete